LENGEKYRYSRSAKTILGDAAQYSLDPGFSLEIFGPWICVEKLLDPGFALEKNSRRFHVEEGFHPTEFVRDLKFDLLLGVGVGLPEGKTGPIAETKKPSPLLVTALKPFANHPENKTP